MNTEQNTFIASIVAAAQASQSQYGIPASVTMAQAILETGWGKYIPGHGSSNNFFGIKSVAGQASVAASTTEFTAGVAGTQIDGFAAYPTVTDGFAAHAKLLSENPRYLPAMNVRSDADAFCTQLQACGYSTSPTYAATLQTLITDYDLTQYDVMEG